MHATSPPLCNFERRASASVASRIASNWALSFHGHQPMCHCKSQAFVLQTVGAVWDPLRVRLRFNSCGLLMCEEWGQ